MRIDRTSLGGAGRVIARFWTANALAITGSVFVLVSVKMNWINFPFSRDLTAVELPLLHGLSARPHLQPLSYGIVAMLVLGFGLLAQKVSRRILTLAAGLLLTLCVLAPLQVSLLQPSILRRLIIERAEISSIGKFTKEYQPANLGRVADIPQSTALDTARERVLTGISFLAPGYYMFTLGVVSCAAYSVTRTTGLRKLSIATFAAIPVVVISLTLIRPLIGEWFFYHAVAAQAQGHNAKATVDYRRALRYDPWYSEGTGVYVAIGDLQGDNAGDSPERQLYKGDQLRKAGQYETAIFEFERAAIAPGRLGKVARRAVAQTRYEYGIALYRAGGIGAAVTNWQRALSSDLSMTYVLPYLAQGSFDLSRYQPALEALDAIIRITSHATLLANAYSLAGDCYAKLGQDAEARRYYRLSLKTDTIDNQWALSGLVGNTP